MPKSFSQFREQTEKQAAYLEKQKLNPVTAEKHGKIEGSPNKLAENIGDGKTKGRTRINGGRQARNPSHYGGRTVEEQLAQIVEFAKKQRKNQNRGNTDSGTKADSVDVNPQISNSISQQR